MKETGMKETDKIFNNRVLLENLMQFVDAAWEIDVNRGSIYILHDKLTPNLQGREISIDEMFSYNMDKSHPKYKETIAHWLNEQTLRAVKEPEEFEIKSMEGYAYETFKCVITPVLDEFGNTEFVYATVQNVKDSASKNDESDKVQEELDRYLTSVSCGILQYTRDTKKLVYANDTALSILGYSSMEEMQNDGFDGVVKTVNLEDSTKIKNLIDNIRTENEIVECEYRVKHKDGKEIYCIGKIRLIDRGDKEPLILRSMIDITAMRNVGNMHKDIADTLGIANMGLWYFILDDGAPKFYVDDVTARLVGASINTSPQDMYNTWYENLSLETRKVVNEAVVKMRNGRPAEVSYLYNHPTRGKIAVRCGGVADASYTGKGVKIRGYHQDITQYNEKLIEQMELSSAVNLCCDGVCYINFANGTTKILASTTDELSLAIEKERSIDSVTEILSGNVLEESRDELRKIKDVDWLVDILSESGKYITYLAMKYGKYRLTFSVTAHDDDGKAERCILFVERE